MNVPQPSSGAPKRRPKLPPSATGGSSTHFIQGAASEAGKSTFWSTDDRGSDESSEAEEESSGDPDLDLDEQHDGAWLNQQRDKLARAERARERSERRGSDVSDISTDDEMNTVPLAPPKGGGRPGGGRPGRKLQVGKTVSFAGGAPPDGDAGSGDGNGGEQEEEEEEEDEASPLHFRPKQLAGQAAVDVELPAAEGGVAEASGADQAPPAWMFKANAGAPNTRYLQKMDEPKKDENKEFRGKFAMNSFLVAQNAMQSFNNGRRIQRKEKRGKVANVQKYQTKIACTYCERARKDEPPWYWSEGRRRREQGEWCKREMLNDTSKVQAVGRLTLCPLHEEDMMQADPNWLDGRILQKSSVWSSLQAADEEREAAENRDLCRRCISKTESGGRWLSSFPDQLPGFPIWVRLLTMTATVIAAFVLAMLPGMDTAAQVGNTGARVTDADVPYSFPLADVKAIAISLDRGAVAVQTVATAGSSSTDVSVVVSHSVGPGADGGLTSLVTVATLDENTGVLLITGTWSGGVEWAFAAPSASLQLVIPASDSTRTLSVEVAIGATGGGVGPDGSSDLALSTAWSGCVAPAGEIVWKGDSSADTYGRVSLATVEGSIAVSGLRAVQFTAASDHGASIALTAVEAHIMNVASGVAAVDADVIVTGQSSWPAAAGAEGIQWVAPSGGSGSSAGGRLVLSTATAASVRLKIGAAIGGSTANAKAIVVVECGSGVQAICTLEVPDTVCGSLVARSEPLAAGVAGAGLLEGFGGALELGPGGFASRTSSLTTCPGTGGVSGTVSTTGAAVVLQTLSLI